MNESSLTARSAAKVERRKALLSAGARLFAAQGFAHVSLEDLGAAVGISGPAVYRHFPSKQAVLAAMLESVSVSLLEGGRQVFAEHDGAQARLAALVAFHVDFALTQPDVIRVQDRDLPSLGRESQHQIRALQRQYVDIWVQALAAVHPGATATERQIRAQATFGLINSTPYALRESRRGESSKAPSADSLRKARTTLESMARAALLA